MSRTFSEGMKAVFLPANPLISALLWGTITLGGVLGIFSSYYTVHNFFFVEGEVSNITIEADRSVTYEDTAKTEENRHAAADRVGDIFVFDSSVLEGQTGQISQLFNAWEELALLSESVYDPAQEAEALDEAGAGSHISGLPGGESRTGLEVPPDRERADIGLPASQAREESIPAVPASGETRGDDAANRTPLIRNADMETKLEKAAPYIAQLQIRESTARVILELDSISLQALRSEAIDIMSRQWTKGVRSEEVEDARRRILDEVYLRVNDEDQASFLQAAYRFIDLRANFIFDEETTWRAKEDAANKEQPVLNTVYRDQKVVGKGEIVTANQILILKALGYQRSEAPYIMLIGIALLACSVFFLLSRYINMFPPKGMDEGKHNPLLSMMLLLILVLARLVVAIKISPEPIVAEQAAYLIPASTGAILIAILLNNWLGVFFGMAVSVFIGLLAGGGMSYGVVAFAGCVIGVYGISRYTNRAEWARAGVMIALVNSWMIIGFGIINNHPHTTILYGVVMGAVNGFFSPILAYGSLPFLESLFKITTSVSLMELSDARQPLLKEMLLKAPGTYHHSILVGNLAEAAADDIGADPVLVRAGAYYHDIGKTKRPYFFIENQLSDANPHNDITPTLSALILVSHVKDGLEIGRKNKLPEKVLDFIAQHHGDGIMAFFYRKARDEAEDPDTVKESDYRYPGPRPQSKETAIVMLADSVEAAMRTLHTSGDKLEVVKRIIRDKMADGQLEDSDLSLSDIKVIAEAFTKVLNGIYHNRIEYPDNVLEEMHKGDLPTGEESAVAADGEAAKE